MKIKVGISNRHVHLNKEILNKLFGDDYNLEVKRYLTQTGEFASNTKVNLRTEAGVIEGVRVVGPLRDYVQVEISKSDADVLQINPPIRNSGDLNNSETLTIVSELGEITLDNVCIIATRHIHMNEEYASYFDVSNGEVVSVKKENIIIPDVHIKIKPNYILECHLDKDDEIKYSIHSDDEVEIVK